MKNIKLIFISATICALLASCGMNTARNNANSSPKPTSTATTNVSDTNNGRVEEDNRTNNSANNDMTNTAGDTASNIGDAAGNMARDAGDVVGDAANGVGDMASDAINGAGDAVGMNGGNNNGQ